MRLPPLRCVAAFAGDDRSFGESRRVEVPSIQQQWWHDFGKPAPKWVFDATALLGFHANQGDVQLIELLGQHS
jgi:hypothetical protein